MRQQYHFRRDAERGLLAWDVTKLVRITRDLPVRQVALADIREIDEAYWFDDRVPTTREIIAHMQLVHEADGRYPIILCPQGRVMDGMHRVAKAVLAGCTTIDAVQLAFMPEPDHVNVAPDDLPYDDAAP